MVFEATALSYIFFLDMVNLRFFFPGWLFLLLPKSPLFHPSEIDGALPPPPPPFTVKNAPHYFSWSWKKTLRVRLTGNSHIRFFFPKKRQKFVFHPCCSFSSSLEGITSEASAKGEGGREGKYGSFPFFFIFSTLPGLTPPLWWLGEKKTAAGTDGIGYEGGNHHVSCGANRGRKKRERKSSVYALDFCFSNSWRGVKEFLCISVFFLCSFVCFRLCR